jgi:hypothetical protein
MILRFFLQKGIATWQNARTMNPILKLLAGFAEIEAVAKHGKLSHMTQAHTLLVAEMNCSKHILTFFLVKITNYYIVPITESKWDAKIFPAVNLQQKFAQVYSNPEELLLSPEVRVKFINSVRKYLIEQGSISKGLDKLSYGDRVTLYENMVDGAVALLTTDSKCGLKKVETLKLEGWKKGLQNQSVESMFCKIFSMP